MPELATNPGSYADFTADRGVEPGPDAIALHSDALTLHRKQLAVARGISLEDLHWSPNTTIGEIATKPSIAAPEEQ